jgi:hypothetical protein
VGFNLGYYVLKLQLGFDNLPYTTRSSRTRTALGRGVRIHKGYGEGKTTADVAKELEEKYQVVEKFWEPASDRIIDMLEEAFADDIEDVMTMQKPSKKGFSDEFTDRFQDILR